MLRKHNSKTARQQPASEGRDPIQASRLRLRGEQGEQKASTIQVNQSTTDLFGDAAARILYKDRARERYRFPHILADEPKLQPMAQDGVLIGSA